SAGAGFSVALKGGDGSVWCWGDNSAGQLGDGSNTSTSVPVQASATGVVFTAISAGSSHVLALDNNGNIWAWGSNNSGELGIGTQQSSNVPQQVDAGSAVFTAIFAGAGFSLAVATDHTVWAWGNNQYGQLGRAGAN